MTVIDGVLRPNLEEVAAEVLEGEAILINLTSGVYYSTDAIGGVVWSLIEKGADVASMVDCLADGYGIDRETVERDLRALVDDLVRENLVTISSSDSTASLALPDPRPSNYEAPRLLVYRDMGELLALDPPAPGLTDIKWTDRKGD